MESLTLRLLPRSVPFFVLRRVAIWAMFHALCIPSSASADEAPAMSAESAPSSTWGLGVADANTQKAYKDIDRKNRVVPILFLDNRYVRVFGPRAEIKLPSLDIGAQKLEFGLLARYENDGYKSGDAPILAGMADRKGGFWLGGKATWQNDIVDVSAEVLADASGHSKSQRATLELERTMHFGPQFMVTPRLSTTWLSSKYVDYYYGVRSSEAQADRPEYSGKATGIAEIGVRTIYRFHESHSLFMDISATSLAKEIKNSPLVDRSIENRVLVGYMYRFQ